MMNYDRTSQNQADHNRKLHMIFVLDTTISMNLSFDGTSKTLLDRMNELVEKMMRELITNPDLEPHAYVSFVCFADGVTMETEFVRPDKFTKADFRRIDTGAGIQTVDLVEKTDIAYGEYVTFNVPVFHSIGCPTASRIGSGVLRAIEKLKADKAQIRKNASAHNRAAHFFAPVMIVITDGAPSFKDDTQETVYTFDPDEEDRAMRAVYSHCFSSGDAENLIFPVICGIGDKMEDTWLENYSQGYKKGWVPIDRNNPAPGFNKLFGRIGTSVTKSVALNNGSWNVAPEDDLPKNGKREVYEKPREFTLNDLWSSRK